MNSLYFLVTLVFVTLSSSSLADKLPVKAYASLPDVDDAILYPDGTKVASLVRVYLPNQKGIAVSIYDVKKNKNDYLVFTDNSKYTITSLAWGNDDFLLATIKYPDSRRGTPVNEWRLNKIDLKSAKNRLVINNFFLTKLDYIPNVLSEVVDYMVDDQHHILMQITGRSTEGEPDVVIVNITKQGRTKYKQRYRKYIRSWMTDAQHNVRIGIKRKKGVYTIVEMSPEDNDMQELWSFEAFSGEHVWPMGFGLDPQILYVRALHKGLDAVYTVNLADPELIKTLVHFDEQYDISGALRHSIKTGEVIGVGNYYWDKNYKNLQTSINKAIPDNKNYFKGFSRDGDQYLVLSTSATEPGMYLLGDRKKKTLKVIAYRYKKLTSDVLAEKQKISYLARDGLKIEGYLTLPKSSVQKNLPTIIFPHGGPISHEGSGFDYWTQFLISRGYAVLQMDFRGSSGYGFDFLKQGIASWGQAMQDDVEDGTRWLIKQGIANPEKICIIGASYGGYAALMGAIKSPDLYQCAVSFAGVSDVEYLVKSSRYFTNYDIVKKQVGSDYDVLWDNSPLKHADKINIPVLLVHGSKDRVVRVKHSEKMYDELEDENKEVEYVELDGGDHYLSNVEHRLETFSKIEQFLEKHL